MSSPSKAVDVMSVLRARCKADAVNDDFNMLAATAAVEKLVAALRFNHATLMKFAETGQPPYADLTKSIELAEAALSTIGESQ